MGSAPRPEPAREPSPGVGSGPVLSAWQRGGWAEPESGPSLYGALGALLRQRRTLLACALLGALVGVGARLLPKRTYTSNASFFTQGRRMNSGLAGLAAQVGLAIPEGEGGQSPAFYVDLVRSRRILEQLAGSTVQVGGRSTTWTQLVETDEQTPEGRLDDAVRELNKSINAELLAKTGVIRVTVRSEDSRLSQQLAARLIALISAYNLGTRQSQAAAERAFTERRLAEVRSDLRSAEGALQSFLEQNRGDISGSAQLRFTFDRLTREVGLREQVYSQLAGAYEQARIEEMRDTPVLTIIDPPSIADKPDSRQLAIFALLGFVIGGMAGLALALVRDPVLGRARAAGEEYAQFRDARLAAAADFRRPWRLLLPSRHRD